MLGGDGQILCVGGVDLGGVRGIDGEPGTREEDEVVVDVALEWDIFTVV